MQSTTALLVSSTDLNWFGLRAILAGWPEVHVIDDVQRREYALAIAVREQPDLILVASDLAVLRLVPLVRDLHNVSSHSRVVVLGQPLDAEDRSQLDALGVVGFIQWKTVASEHTHSWEGARSCAPEQGEGPPSGKLRPRVRAWTSSLPPTQRDDLSPARLLLRGYTKNPGKVPSTCPTHLLSPSSLSVHGIWVG